jgi:hypothetical protein
MFFRNDAVRGAHSPRMPSARWASATTTFIDAAIAEFTDMLTGPRT